MRIYGTQVFLPTHGRWKTNDVIETLDWRELPSFVPKYGKNMIKMKRRHSKWIGHRFLNVTQICSWKHKRVSQVIILKTTPNSEENIAYFQLIAKQAQELLKYTPSSMLLVHVWPLTSYQIKFLDSINWFRIHQVHLAYMSGDYTRSRVLVRLRVNYDIRQHMAGKLRSSTNDFLSLARSWLSSLR